MSDNNFTPYAIIPTPATKDKTNLPYTGQPDLPVEPVTDIEENILTNKLMLKLLSPYKPEFDAWIASMKAKQNK